MKYAIYYSIIETIMLNTRQLPTLLCFTLICFAGMWAYMQIYLHPITNKIKRDDIFDYTMENVTVIRFNHQGKPASKITTPFFVHFPKNDTAFFTNPIFTITQKKINPWIINAGQGKSQTNMEDILLTKHVSIYQAAGPQQTETTLLTDNLHILPKQDLAETPSPVAVRQPGVKMNSIGMRINLLDNRVELLSQARGDYEK